MSEMDKLFTDNKSQTSNPYFVWTVVFTLFIVFAFFAFLYLYFLQNTQRQDVYSEKERIYSLDDLGQVAYNNEYQVIQNTAPDISDLYLLFSASPANSTVMPTLYIQALDKEDFAKIKKRNGSSIYNADLVDKTLAAIEVNQADLKSGNTPTQVAKIIIDNNFLDDFSVLDAKILNVNIDKFLHINKLALSPDKKHILISATDESIAQKRAKINAWSIFLINLQDNSVVKLFNGIAPEWISNSSFVFVSEQGLSVFNIQAKMGRIVIKDNTKTVTDELIYNKNSKILAWSNLRDSKIYLFKARDIKIGIFNPIDTIKKQAISLAFDEDGKLLSFIEFEGFNAHEIKNAKLRLYNIASRAFVQHRQEDDNLEKGIYVISMNSVAIIRHK